MKARRAAATTSAARPAADHRAPTRRPRAAPTIAAAPQSARSSARGEEDNFRFEPDSTHDRGVVVRLGGGEAGRDRDALNLPPPARPVPPPPSAIATPLSVSRNAHSAPIECRAAHPANTAPRGSQNHLPGARSLPSRVPPTTIALRGRRQSPALAA